MAPQWLAVPLSLVSYLDDDDEDEEDDAVVEVVLSVVVASLSVVLSVGCPIGLTGPVVVAAAAMVVDDDVVAVVDDDAVVVVAEGVFAKVDENTASF